MAIQCIQDTPAPQSIEHLEWFRAPAGFEPEIEPGNQLLVEPVEGFSGPGFYLKAETRGSELVRLDRAEPQLTHRVKSKFIPL